MRARYFPWSKPSSLSYMPSDCFSNLACFTFPISCASARLPRSVFNRRGQRGGRGRLLSLSCFIRRRGTARHGCTDVTRTQLGGPCGDSVPCSRVPEGVPAHPPPSNKTPPKFWGLNQEPELAVAMVALFLIGIEVSFSHGSLASWLTLPPQSTTTSR